MPVCLIRGASFVSDVVVMNPLIDVSVVSSVAAVVSVAARNQDLRRQINVGPGPLSHDFDAVAQG